MIRLLRERVAGLMELTRAELLFCPAGVGRHVDHLITRDLGRDHPAHLVMYSDFPYNLVAGPDKVHLSEGGFVPWSWDLGLQTKPGRIRQYATQADALFPSGEIPLIPENYFVPAWPSGAP